VFSSRTSCRRPQREGHGQLRADRVAVRRACDDSTNRWRRRISEATWARVDSVTGVVIIGIRDGPAPARQPRRPAAPPRRAGPRSTCSIRSWCATDSSIRKSISGTRRSWTRWLSGAQEGRRTRQRLLGGLALGRITERRVVDVGDLQIGGDLDARQGDEPIPGSCTWPRVSISLISWRIWSPNPFRPVAQGHAGTAETEAPARVRRAGRFRHGTSRPWRPGPFRCNDLDDVADLDVVVLVEADTALEAGLDLADVVLETGAGRPMRPSWTTTLSRSSRACTSPDRVMRPSVTMQPRSCRPSERGTPRVPRPCRSGPP